MRRLRYILFPFAFIYHLVTWIRNICFDKGVLKSTRFDLPIIAVGNLNMGGTGKTPQIEYLIRLLSNQYKIAVLSRGYKRATSGFVLADSATKVKDIGDEPFQFFNKFETISVAVDANRVEGIGKLEELKQPDVMLLDDAFQHRKVKAGFYILLTAYHDLYTNDFVLPAGNLREGRAGAKRADVIVVTKCPDNLSNEEMQQIERKLKPKEHQNVFFTKIAYDSVLLGDETYKTLGDIKEKDVVLISGIANPNPLKEYLSINGVSFEHLSFGDHHNFSETEIENFRKLQADGKMLLTTEKDYMRLKRHLSLSYVAISSQFINNKSIFDKKIISYVGQNSKNRIIS
ncbi:tetraacyldisaccharide 4'-kinase [Urechidicola sp. KH5]